RRSDVERPVASRRPRRLRLDVDLARADEAVKLERLCGERSGDRAENGRHDLLHALILPSGTRTTWTLHGAFAVTVDATDCDHEPFVPGAPRMMRSTWLNRAKSTSAPAGSDDSIACSERRCFVTAIGSTQCRSRTRCSRCVPAESFGGGEGNTDTAMRRNSLLTDITCA